MSATIDIGGRRFPVVALICPQHEDGQPWSDDDRALGTGIGGDQSCYIPAENGLLFEVEPDEDGTLQLSLRSRSCEHYDDHEDHLWLPETVTLIDGELVAGFHPRLGGAFYWRKADAEWVAETIDRLSQKRFVQPDGPEVQLVHRDSEAVDA